ncbi:ABC transporter permease [Enterobacteriaceae bacterium C23F]
MNNVTFRFSLTRWLGIVFKEINELRRDRVSIGMVFFTPLLQLVILGYAVNMDPRTIPTALLNYDTERMGQVFVTAAQNTDYFAMLPVASEKEAEEAFIKGDVIFIVTIPKGFTQKLLRGEKPQILIQGDAIDPMTTGNALSAIVQASKNMFRHDLPNSVHGAAAKQGDDIELVIHRMFNPEGITQYNTIPGIIGSILSTTLILMTALAITRERENGAMENLLISPVTGLEVILGKITPYVIIGIFQSLMILIFAVFLFNIPLLGNVFLLIFVLILYIFLCLSIGISISSVAQNQLQALQMSSFYFIPSVMLSGFISPFISMPVWAQAIGSCLPLTYFIRLIKGLMLKGYTLMDLLPELLPLVGLTLVVILIGLKTFRQTLD